MSERCVSKARTTSRKTVTSWSSASTFEREGISVYAPNGGLKFQSSRVDDLTVGGDIVGDESMEFAAIEADRGRVDGRR
jgi:hypothetical protein